MGGSSNLTLHEADTQQHIPVLLDEVVAYLAVASGGAYLDATIGGGGHAEAMLNASAPDGRLLGLDRDPEAVARAHARLRPFGERARVRHAPYTRLRSLAETERMLPLDGILFDLGFSSWQIDDPTRGFSFRFAAPLDMRYNPESATPTAAELVNTLPPSELADVIYEYGEEGRSRQIASAIVAARPIRDTQYLAEVIAAAVGQGAHQRGIHPATKTFQALRIAVNRELEMLEAALPEAVAALRPGGRLAVISFHSLEDRIVKHFFKREASACICPPEIPICVCDHKASVRVLTSKPIRPTEAEIAANPRSRSAKLRIVERI